MTQHSVFQLNGYQVTAEVEGDEVLLDTVRRLGAKSVRGACGIGVCGTCTVLVDGKPVSSCLKLTASVDGRSVITSEGLVTDAGLDPVQRAFVERGAYQCSFCIPAMVLTVRAALDELRAPTVQDIREYLGGNLCRCATYPEILQAVQDLLCSDGSD